MRITTLRLLDLQYLKDQNLLGNPKSEVNKILAIHLSIQQKNNLFLNIQYGYPRNLSTQDIPGAIPQTKNARHSPIRGRELEAQTNLQASSQNVSQNQGPEILTKPRINEKAEDSLDKFAREYHSQSVEPKRNNYDKFIREIELNNRLAASKREGNHQLRSSYAADLTIANSSNNQSIVNNLFANNLSHRPEESMPIKSKYRFLNFHLITNLEDLR